MQLQLIVRVLPFQQAWRRCEHRIITLLFFQLFRGCLHLRTNLLLLSEHFVSLCLPLLNQRIISIDSVRVIRLHLSRLCLILLELLD